MKKALLVACVLTGITLPLASFAAASPASSGVAADANVSVTPMNEDSSTMTLADASDSMRPSNFDNSDIAAPSMSED